MSTIRPIRTDDDHRQALAEIDRLWGSPDGTPEGDRLDVLCALVEKYEEEHFPMEMPDPIGAIEFAMEQNGYGVADLAQLVGSQETAAALLARRQALTMEMIRVLASAWHI